MRKIRNMSLKKLLPLLLISMPLMIILSGCAYTMEEYRATADYFSKSGNHDYAISYATSATNNYPSDPSSWKLLGMSHIKNGQFDEAISALKKAAEVKTIKTEIDKALLDACNGHYLYRQGDMTGAAEKFKSAEPYLDRLLDGEEGVTTFYAYIYKVYGSVLQKTGETETALKMYRRAMELGAEDTAKIVKSLEALIKGRIAEEKGRIAEKNGELRKAIEHYRTAFAVMSRAGLDTKEIQEDIINIVLRLDPPPAVPKDVERYLSRGLANISIAQSEGDYKNAVEEFKKALELAPWHPTIYYNMGLVQERAELFEDAIQSFSLFLLAAPDDPDAKEVLNKIYYLEVQAEKAAEFKHWKGRWVDLNDGDTYNVKVRGDKVEMIIYEVTSEMYNTGYRVGDVYFHGKIVGFKANGKKLQITTIPEEARCFGKSYMKDGTLTVSADGSYLTLYFGIPYFDYITCKTDSYVPTERVLHRILD